VRQEKKRKEKKRERGSVRTNRKTTAMSYKLEDHMALTSQLYPGVFTQMVPQQG
jgi:hypothetical protein